MLRGSGSLSAERKEYLEGLGSQLGLSNDERDKIIREARTEALGAAAAFEGEERWTVEKVGTAVCFGVQCGSSVVYERSVGQPDLSSSTVCAQCVTSLGTLLGPLGTLMSQGLAG